ncbi:hypothetical protein DPPLL_32780 [Desulfofustis limnaeus]|uniref:histidine kinase n=2 Tax=Desulfofustis limnaeus TaxID=2740163 RepID=A0ABN6M7Q9_9BACT|nr:hypothetical protein DPPLL_32780 [Desulfofustis limnaeus]
MESWTLLGKSNEDILVENQILRELYQCLPLSYQSLDKNGCLIEINRAWTDLFGYSREEALGKNFGELLSPILEERFRATFSERKSLIEILGEEFPVISKNGKELIVRGQGNTVHDSQGNLLRTHCLLQDVTQIRKTENEVKEREKIYRFIFEESSNPIFITDENGRFLNANRSTLDFFECTSDELIKKNLCSFSRRKSLDEIPNLEINTVKPTTTETQYFINGNSKIILLSLFPIELRGKSVICGIGQNITAHSKTKNELKSTNQLLSLFIKHSPIYAFIKEVDSSASRTLVASENYRDMIGISAEEMIGKTMQELFPAEFADKMTADDWSVITNGKNLCLDEEFNGRYYTTYKFPLEIGGTNFLAGYTVDITDRKKAEEESRRRGNLLQQIFEILPIGLWFVDKDGKILRGNPKGIKIWGGEPQVPMEEYGLFKAWRIPSYEPVGPDDWALTKTIREGVIVIDELLEIETFTGQRKKILNYTAPILDESGNVDGAIVVNLDVTERLLLEEKFQQSQKMESIGRLAGGVAHDFNNMLSVILGNVELLLQKVNPEDEIYDYLTEILNAGDRSKEITRQLLAFARKQTIAPRILDVNQTIQQSLSMVPRLIGENIEISFILDEDIPHVRMDPSQIDQILINLCVNARDAIDNVGWIKIHTKKTTLDHPYCVEHSGAVPGDYVLLTVSDNGCGMSEKTLSQVFEPFFTTKDPGKGTGLGLATVYGIVQQNNGYIKIYSELGAGTTCNIYLPAHQDKSTGVEESVIKSQKLLGGETVLLVEDEPMILKFSRRVLESLGYIVLAASSPGEAIALARENSGEIHLLVTDVIMPEMNGRDLARNIQSLYPDIICLFMSGYTSNVIAHHGIIDEGINFIQKPFSVTDLSIKIREALDSVSH